MIAGDRAVRDRQRARSVMPPPFSAVVALDLVPSRASQCRCRPLRATSIVLADRAICHCQRAIVETAAADAAPLSRLVA